jgi:flagellar hook assembly protein FlgD
VSLTLLYLDPDNDGVINNVDCSSTGVSEDEELAVYFFNGKTWEYVGGTKNIQDNTITVSVQRFGRYGIFVKGSGQQPQKVDQKVFTPATPLVFPSSFVEVTIMSPNGNKVVTLPRPSQSGARVIWTGTDKNGKTIESGVYIYKAKDDNGKVHTGMIIFAK